MEFNTLSVTLSLSFGALFFVELRLLNIDDTIRHIIYEGSLTQLHRYLQKCGFESFRKAAIAKVTAGLTTMAEIRRVLPYSAFNRRTQGQEGVPFKANLRRASLHHTV